jgi:adenylate kinase family enzyme
VNRQSRLVIVGSSCAGKTTTAKLISQKLKITHIELDALFWKPGWQESTDEELFPKVEKAVAQEQWVLDGNYGRVSDIVWSQATDVLWLDYPLTTILKRFFRRSITRSFSGELLWNGCRENLRCDMPRHYKATKTKIHTQEHETLCKDRDLHQHPGIYLIGIRQDRFHNARIYCVAAVFV